MLLLLPVPVPSELAEDFVELIVIPTATAAAEIIIITIIKVREAARALQNTLVSVIGTLDITISLEISESV